MPFSSSFSFSRWCGLCRRSALVAFTVAIAISTRSAIAQTAPGDPALQISQVFPNSARWRPTESIGYKVEILHPYATGRSTPTPWITAPAGGWGPALRLIVTDASGATVPWPFRLSAPNKTQPLEISHLMSAGAAFNLDPRTSSIPVLPGTYTVQAEFAVSSGNGWRGRVVSKALPLTVLPGIEPVLELHTIVEGPLVQGVPWGFRARLSNPDDPDAKQIQLRGGANGWPTNTQLILRNEAGALVSWNWTAPRLPASDNRFLNPGESFPVAQYRLSSTNSTQIPPGQYSLTARYVSAGKDPVFDYWLGSVESAPVSITVQTPTVPEDISSAARRWRWEAEDALEEAKGLRLLASETGAPNDRRLELTRQAAVPLLRAETAAQRWFLLAPSSPEPALLLSQILVNQDDKYLAAAWVQTASEIDLATPGTEPDAPPRNSNAPNPFLLSWRQAIDALPEVPNALLSPELQFTLNLARGTLPEPTNLVEQDKYFGADPRGQWAAFAQASSEYRSASFSAARATGAPDVQSYGDNGNAWATKLADAPDEWIELTFAQPTRAAAVRVRQNFNPGAIVRVDLIDTNGLVQTVFQGTDTNVYARSTIGWFAVKFPTTTQPIARVRLSLDSLAVRGWNEIDAVQLVAGTVTQVEAPRLQFDPRSVGTRELVISSWPDGFVLERATKLLPPDWQRFADRPPVTLPLGSTSEFFRLTHQGSPSAP
ncbi:MAG: hypothetical protein IT581_10135 [Verrucomicrobiales bacterium]|nr:hypothetical protein [Verrucomicrobiales bacterium]